VPFAFESFPVFSRKNLVISKKNFVSKKKKKTSRTHRRCSKTTTTGVDDELEGAKAGEISLGADAHAPIIMILFYVVYRVLLLSLTKSILEKKRKRAVFHKLIITFYNEEVVLGAKRDRFRERGKESKKNDHQKRRLFSLLPFFMSFFRAFLYFLTRQSVISRQSLPFLFRNKLESFLFTSQSASRCVCTQHCAESDI
jgi:hypothetical protein